LHQNRKMKTILKNEKLILRHEPGKGAWSDDDLLCRTDQPARAAPGPIPLPPDGLGALIARMDAEPVRFVKGGFVH